MNRDGAKASKVPEASKKCDLCDDNTIPEKLMVKGRCHLTAPLRVILEGNVLVLKCYLPECDREVGRFIVTKFPGQK